MRSLLTIMTALSGLAAAGLLRPSFLLRQAPSDPSCPPQRDSLTKSISDRSIDSSYHPILSGSVSVYPLYVTTSTPMATPSRSHLHAPFSMHRRTLNATAPPTITDIATSSNNLALASEFNMFFSMMNPNSACNLKINAQATVCINEQIATCGNDGKYKLQPCPVGRKCRAVPLDAGRMGLSIQCVPNDDGIMAQLTSRSTNPASALLMRSSTPLGRESGSAIITNNKTAAPSLIGNKLNNMIKTMLHTSGKTQQVAVKPSQASSTVLYPSATVPNSTTTAAEINSKSGPPVFRNIPITRGRNATQQVMP